MTSQSNADNSNSGHGRHTIWQRLSPFLDVIGAVLIFGSWVLSHALLQQAQDQAKTHEGIIGRVDSFRLYDDFCHQISEIQSDLVRTRNLVEQTIPTNSLKDGGALPETLTWTGMTATQVRELSDFVQELERYAGKLSTTRNATELIETAKREARQTAVAFDSARDEYDRLVEEQNASNSPAANEAAAKPEQEELRRRVDHLWHEYDTTKQGMMSVSDELLRAAAAESESASRLAKQCEHLSWALYIVGTLIVLFGRAKSVMSAKKAPAD